MNREGELHLIHATYPWLNLFFKVMDVWLKPVVLRCLDSHDDGRRTGWAFSTLCGNSRPLFSCKDGLFTFIEYKGEFPPAGYNTWFKLAREGRIPCTPKRREEAEDDYEGQIPEGPKEKKRKFEDKKVLVGDDSVH